MSIQDLVNVQVSRDVRSVSRTGFSTLNILGVNKAFTARLQYYSTLSAVLDDFISTDKEYIAAQVAFAQSPSVTRIAISRRATGDTVVCTVDTVVDNTNYSLTFDGVTYTIDSGVGATAINIAAALKVAFDLGSSLGTFTDNADGTYDIDPTVAGADYTLSVDTRQSMAFTLSTTPAADLAAISEEQDDWYGLVYTIRLEVDILLIAAYIESVKKVYGIGDSDADIVNTTDAADTTTIPAQLKALAYVRSFTIYNALAATTYPEAAALGSVLPLNPGSWTLNTFTLTGITVDSLTSTQRTNALAKYCNVYTAVGGFNITEKGAVAEGEWLDIIIFIDWIQARITEEEFSLLVNSKKVPYTDGGIAGVEARITQVLQQGQSPAYGGIALDDGEGGPAFTVSVPERANISDADVAARTLNNVTFTAILSGAIHAMTINGTVTY